MVKKGLAIVEERKGWQISLGEKESDPRVKGEKGKEKEKRRRKERKKRETKERKSLCLVSLGFFSHALVFPILVLNLENNANFPSFFVIDDSCTTLF